MPHGLAGTALAKTRQLVRPFCHVLSLALAAQPRCDLPE